MKTFSLISVLALSALSFAENPALPQYSCSKISEKSITIDGKQSEQVWKKAPVIEFSSIDSAKSPENGKTKAQLLWDSQNLYIFFQSSDKDIWNTMQKHDDAIWKQDAIELFLDPNGDGKNYYEFEWNHAGVSLDFLMKAPWGKPNAGNTGTFNPKGILSKSQLHGTANDSSDIDQGFDLEIQIPWTALDSNQTTLPPKVGDKMRLNLYRVEYPQRKGSGEWTAWSPTGAIAAHKPKMFGTLILSE